jgi:flagellin-like hook-associated protein FlgL
MTTVSKTMFPVGNAIKNISSMKARYDDLLTQLSTGLKASNLGELGTSRYFDLSMRARIARIHSYLENVKTVNLRLDLLDTTVSRLGDIQSDARAASASGNNGSTNLSYQTTPTLAASRFNEVMTLLGTDIAGRYLFGGSTTESKPVAGADAVIEGQGGRAGFRQVVSERQAADLGADHLGRLSLGTTADTVTLGEDGSHPFGLKLANLSTSTANIAITPPSGSPAQLSVQFNDANLPADGDQVTIGFTLPDGTEEQVVLTATSSDEPGPGQFQIGADAAATAGNFGTTLAASIKGLAEGQLTVASSFVAADSFFNGQGETAMRVDGPPFESATGLRAATAADTVTWYTGEDTSDPRHTVTARVGDGTSVAYGVQANENGFVQLIRSLAAVSIQSMGSDDPNAGVKYAAAVNRNSDRLAQSKQDQSGSIEVISVELGLAKTTANTVNDRQTTQAAQLGDMLSDIETAPQEQVSAEILALQTRLSASYETTSALAKLSLVNFLN